jgi:hypothetical protein
VKTISLKKVAVIAVASLGFGLMSVVPAYAAGNTYMWCDAADGLASGATATAGNDACNGVAGAANTVSIEFEDAPATSRVTVSGAGASITSNDNPTDLVVATNGLSGTFSATAAGNDANITVSTTAIGTVTVSLFELVSAGIYGATAEETVTVTVNATASSGVVSTIYSKVSVGDGVQGATGITSGSDDTIAESGLTAGSLAAIISVEGKDALNAALTTGTVKAEVTSGPGIVSVDNDAANNGTDGLYADGGKTDSASVDASGAGTLANGDDITGVAYVHVYADGTAGVSTIKISLGTTVLATKTVTFYANVATVVATQSLSVASTAGATLGDSTSATAGAVYVKLTDSNNNPAVAAVTATPADTTVISTGTCAAVATVPGTYSCEVLSAANTSGKSTTVVFSAVGASSAVIKSAPITFTLGGATPSTVTMAFDKALYTSGAPVTLTITAKDSSGNPVSDGAKANLVATAGLAFNYATGIATTGTEVNALKFNKGIATIKTFAPLAGGSISVSGTLGTGVATAAQGSAVSTTAAVTDASSTLMTQIDALNAKIVALNALIAKIMKKLGVK